jgi:ubiquitin-like protein ATG12
LTLCRPKLLFQLTWFLVTVRFQPLPSAPILKNRVFKISASQKFETVVKFLRKKLDCKDTDSVFCYVNSVFAPGLDEGVGGLWRVSASNYFFYHF